MLREINNKGCYLYYPTLFPSCCRAAACIERRDWSARRLMKWCDLISSIIFSSSVVHAFNSSCLNELCGHRRLLCAWIRVGVWAAVEMCWCPSWMCHFETHSFLLQGFCFWTIEISLSSFQTGQIHTSDRGHCVTHRLDNPSKGKWKIFHFQFKFHCHSCVNGCDDLLKDYSMLCLL